MMQSGLDGFVDGLDVVYSWLEVRYSWQVCGVFVLCVILRSCEGGSLAWVSLLSLWHMVGLCLI